MGDGVVQQLANDLGVVLVGERGEQRDLAVEVAVALVANLCQHLVHLEDERRVEVLVGLHAPIGGVERPGDHRCRPAEEDGRFGASEEHERAVRDMPLDEEAHLSDYLLLAERPYRGLLLGVLVDVALAGELDRLRVEVVDIRLEGNVL